MPESSHASANTAFAFGNKASANTAFAFGNPSPSCTKKLFSSQPVQPAAEQKSPRQLRDEISETDQVILSPWPSPHCTLTIF
jgi:hypothetical protein